MAFGVVADVKAMILEDMFLVPIEGFASCEYWVYSNYVEDCEWGANGFVGRMVEEFAEFLIVEDKKGWFVFGISEKVDRLSFKYVLMQFNFLADILRQWHYSEVDFAVDWTHLHSNICFVRYLFISLQSSRPYLPFDCQFSPHYQLSAQSSSCSWD